MTISLDPKFAKVIALWRSTQHAGEKASARARAEEITAAASLIFDEALAAIDTPRPTASPFAAQRRKESAARRAAVPTKYGSEQLALAPCGRERLVLAAVAKWRRPLERDKHFTASIRLCPDAEIAMDVKLAQMVSIEGLSVRFYTASEAEPEYPWTSFADLLALLELPEREKIITVLPAATPHSFRRGSDGSSAISHFAALELIDEFASPTRAAQWREAAGEIFAAHCRAPTESEWAANLAAAAKRSHDIANAGIAKLQATASKH